MSQTIIDALFQAGAVVLAAAALTGAARAQDRLPPLKPQDQTTAQTAASDQFRRERGVSVFGPFVPLLRSPQLMLRAHEMGQYLRYNSALPPRLSEMAILLIARDWNQAVEWEIHRPAALKAGLSLATVEAIAERRRPSDMEPDAAAVYDVFDQLMRTRQIDDDLYARASRELGVTGLVDLTGVFGYYTLLAMTMNVARTSTAGADVAPLP